MEGKKSISINFIASMIVFAINLAISFFFTPFITKKIGTEAYGFVSLANNFVNYATLITIALNSMSGRFVSVAIHKNKKDEANAYFSSVFWANIIIISVLVVPSLFIILYLERILNIPNEIIIDVKLLFSFIFINFFIGIISSTFQIATFATNKLHLQSIRNLEGHIIRVILLFLLCSFFTPHVFYIGLTSLLVSIFVLLYNIYYKKKLLPDLSININNISLKKISEVVKSGIWYSITKIGQILSDGLDLIICNIFIDPFVMGQLAIVKTLSSYVGTLIGTISGLFQPEFIISYAHGKIDELISKLKFSMKASGMISNIPFAFLIVFGMQFYLLWLPNQDAEKLHLLTILTLQGVIISGAINPMYAIYSVTNKVKVDAICRIIIGLLCTFIVYVLLKNTELGVYAVAGVSTLVGSIFNFFFVPVYVSKVCLQLDWKTFYPCIINYALTTIALIGIFFIMGQLFILSNWLYFIIMGIVCVIVGVIFDFFFLFEKNERKDLIDFIKVFGKKLGVNK